jgi:schlafen family protein
MISAELAKLYLTNSYRVLLTRARQGMAIYIPKGDASDSTHPSAFYDGTADLLAGCGLVVSLDRPGYLTSKRAGLDSFRAMPTA